MEDMLLKVNKPGRYIGQEWNMPVKDFKAAEVKFALCFPDLYELGMSNLGVRIIYGILNSLDYASCERFFSPASDMEKVLRDNNMPISSLESRRPLGEFDLVGFSLAYELSYTNVLNILDLGQIPLRASSRDCRHPLVIAGGPCALNPEPMHEFFDLFVIGEAEDAIIEITGAYRRLKEKFKRSEITREELLIALAQIEGVYAPSLYEANYSREGKINSFQARVQDAPARIRKRFVRDLDKAYFPLPWLVPYLQIVHDRLTLEVMRGCPNSCRFCQARQLYYPFRKRQINNILNLAADAYRSTGYEEISLCGLSVSDYPDMEKLLTGLVNSFKAKAVSISLPSIKPKASVGNLSFLISTIKKTGLTFAPEAGSERLRLLLGKDFDLADFRHGLEGAYLAGYRHIKLYFMIGLPGEENRDLDGIVELANFCSELKREVDKKPAQVNVSVSTLIPKPHTPLQWFKMEPMDSIKTKQDYLKSRAGNRRLRLSFHNRQMSFLEGVFSRGDRRLSQVVYGAFKRGARFDAWDDHFRFEKWLDAFKESNLNPDFYLEARDTAEFLPWDFLEAGQDKETLAAEFNKVIAIK